MHTDHVDRSPGGYSHRNAIRGCAAQMGRFLTKKSLNMGPIFGPKIPKHGSIFFKFSENLKKKKPVFGAQSLNMGPFLEQNP